jgi:hypothetical protein
MVNIINPTKQVEVVVNFKKPQVPQDIVTLLQKALTECNDILKGRWRKLSFFKRMLKPYDAYYLEDDVHQYCSYDGKSPMKRCKHILNSEEYPEAKYEYRHLLSIYGTQDYRLYFNVIPGIAREDQFGTEMVDNEEFSCITIKANMKSELKWKRIQAEFLEMLVPIIERIDGIKKMRPPIW